MQFELFDRSRQSSDVVWFPVRHRRRFLSIVARNLLDREGRRRAKRLRLELGRLEGDMIVAGIRDRTFINNELSAFVIAVEAEMRRQVIVEALRSEQDGAA